MKHQALWILVFWLLPGVLTAQASELVQVRQLAIQGRLPDALERVDAMLASNPGSAEAKFVKGFVLARAGRENEAQALFLELTRSHPEYPEPFNNLAVLYAKQGDYERAVEILKQALQTHSSYRTAYENLTKVYGKLASRAYDRALGQESTSGGPSPSLQLLSDLDPSPTGGGAAPAQQVVVQEPLPARVAPSEPIAVAPPAQVASPPATEETTSEASFDAAELVDLVKAWAAAWSEQRVDDYLALYSPGFRPDGMSRAVWESQRRVRIMRPRFIEVEVSSIGVRPMGASQAQVRFIQRYRSESFSDQVIKTLDMVLENDAWKIQAETSREQ